MDQGRRPSLQWKDNVPVLSRSNSASNMTTIGRLGAIFVDFAKKRWGEDQNWMGWNSGHWMKPVYSRIFDDLWSRRRDKTPGPDGFNIVSFQEFWHIMNKDIVDFFQDLHEGRSFVNTTFLVLIAKFGGVCNIKNFKPISLVGCIYISS